MGRQPTPPMAGVLKILSVEPYKGSYPNMVRLLQIALVQPLNRAACERGFSCQNDTKTRNRSRLTVASLDALMRICLYGPAPKHMRYKDAIKRWRKGVKTYRRPLYRADTYVTADIEESESD